MTVFGQPTLNLKKHKELLGSLGIGVVGAIYGGSGEPKMAVAFQVKEDPLKPML